VSYGICSKFSYAFQPCKNLGNRLRFDKVIDSQMVGTFLRHSVVYHSGDGQTSCKVWLTSIARRRCSNEAKTRNSLKFTGVPQTPEQIISSTSPHNTDFQKFYTAGKRIKFAATKLIRQYPSHLRYVATLPWEIKNSNFLQIFSRYGRKCKQIAF